MQLPQPISQCIRMLENAGFAAYAVGGCVRDDRMGIVPHDFDLCTSALPEQTEAVFSGFPQVHAGVKHGTVGVVTDFGVVEITTFRSEGTYADNRHPDWVDFVTDIEKDLSRRDYTMNAMAWSPTRGYADPFHGKEDIENGILRAVGDPDARFREDSLRILRGIRFAARFRLSIEGETERAMFRRAPLMQNLARERVYAELCGFLPKATAEDLARFAPILTQVIPELAPMVGFDQHSPHHAYDVYTHTAHVLEAVPEDLVLRWAALLHDVGKVPTFTRDETGRGHFYGHARKSAELADAILHRLKAPNAVTEQVVWLIDHHMLRLTPDRKLLRRYLSRYGRDALYRLCMLQEADMGSKGTGEHQADVYFAQIRQLLAALEAEEGCLSLKTLAVNGNDLKAMGLEGRQIGSCLQQLLEQVLEETLPNSREELLLAAEAMAEQMENE